MQAQNYEYLSEFARRYKAEGKAEGEAKGLAEGKAEGLAEGKAEGLAEGKAKGLLLALDLKGFEVTDRLRERILACTDLDVLAGWYERVKPAGSLADIFDPALLA